MEFSVFPAETIAGICEQMDTKSLINFSMTSKVHSEICNEILEKRGNQLVDELLKAAKSEYRKQVVINSPNPNHKFILEWTGLTFELAEYVYHEIPIYFMERIGFSERTDITYRFEGYINIDKIRQLLLDLFYHGYISNYYVSNQRIGKNDLFLEMN